ncbi:MAG: hypothetical protein ACF8PN_16705 [Phycisphaerales bacterium]
MTPLEMRRAEVDLAKSRLVTAEPATTVITERARSFVSEHALGVAAGAAVSAILLSRIGIMKAIIPLTILVRSKFVQRVASRLVAEKLLVRRTSTGQTPMVNEDYYSAHRHGSSRSR